MFSFRGALVKTGHLIRTLTRPQSHGMATSTYQISATPQFHAFFVGPHRALLPPPQILGRYKKMCQNLLPLSNLEPFAIQKFWRNLRRDQEDHENGKKTRNLGLSGFCLGLTGFLFNKEKLSCEKENELVTSLKTGILAILDGKCAEAEKHLERVWNLTRDVTNCGAEDTQRFDLDLTLMDRLFTILQLASDKMELDVDENCFLEIITKLGGMIQVPITEEMKKVLQTGYQYYEGSHHDKIKQAKKDKNELKLVAIYFEILSQAVTLMSGIEEGGKDKECVQPDKSVNRNHLAIDSEASASNDVDVPRYLEISAHGVTIMVTDETEEQEVCGDDVDTVSTSKDEYGQDDENSASC